MAESIKCRVCEGIVSSEASPPCPHCKDPWITEARKNQHEQRVREWKMEEEKKKAQSEAWRRQGLCPECGSRLDTVTCRNTGRKYRACPRNHWADRNW
jgi:predicted RNA-binding Zn-ribbon protein involved in translation (DUF1610 family)